mmetsp:Transcript_406/g.764  ORF Transcript_406/g.764 Transcript_406/m.764 type:complete len:117 (+) Transcript_406:206-556(+)
MIVSQTMVTIHMRLLIAKTECECEYERRKKGKEGNFDILVIRCMRTNWVFNHNKMSQGRYGGAKFRAEPRNSYDKAFVKEAATTVITADLYVRITIWRLVWGVLIVDHVECDTRGS